MRSRRERVNRRTVSERSVARTTSREWATRVCDKRAKWAPHYMDMGRGIMWAEEYGRENMGGRQTWRVS